VSPELWIEIANWDRFQHYKDRNPPWIKNYTELLHNPNYLELPLRLRGILHGLWLLYAASHRKLPASTSYINRALGLATEWEARKQARQRRELGESVVSEWRERGESLVSGWRVDGESPVRMRDLNRLEHSGFIKLVAITPLDLARSREVEAYRSKDKILPIPFTEVHYADDPEGELSPHGGKP
jgi:hypothetical protein